MFAVAMLSKVAVAMLRIEMLSKIHVLSILSMFAVAGGGVGRDREHTDTQAAALKAAMGELLDQLQDVGLDHDMLDRALGNLEMVKLTRF